MEYIVRTSPKAGREELKWAVRFTVLNRENFQCQHCGSTEPPLDIAHIESRKARPDLEFDPDNTMLLCHPCHMTFDHQNGHRPSGRPVGYRLSEESKAKIGAANARAKADPEWRRQASVRTSEQWDTRGRKPDRDCERCGKALTRYQITRDYRFCGKECRYAFAKGKPRSGW